MDIRKKQLKNLELRPADASPSTTYLLAQESTGAVDAQRIQLKAVYDVVDAKVSALSSTVESVYAAKNSPTFTGAPLSTTPLASDGSTKIATTAFVQSQKHNPTFTGNVTSLGDVNIYKSLVFCENGVSSIKEEEGNDMLSSDANDSTILGNTSNPTIIRGTNVTGLTKSMVGLANVVNESKDTMFTNPVFTGVIKINSNDSGGIIGSDDTQVFSFDSDQNMTIGVYTKFDHTPTAPTVPGGTNDTQLATTAFVNKAITAGIRSVFNSMNYVMVYGVGTPAYNALELQAAYNKAKTMSPSAGNVITVIVAPGYYDFGANAFAVNAPYIDIVSMTGNADVIVRSSELNDNLGYTYGVNVTADYVFVKGINCQELTFAIANDLDNVVCEYCNGGHDSFGGANGITSGRFINCTGGNNSFGREGTLSGILIDCKLSTGAFETPTGAGRIYNCIDGAGALINYPAFTFNVPAKVIKTLTTGLTYSILPTDDIIVIDTDGINVKLPLIASGLIGKEILITVPYGTSNVATLSCQAADNIGGSNAIYIGNSTSEINSIRVIAMGSGWVITSTHVVI